MNIIIRKARKYIEEDWGHIKILNLHEWLLPYYRMSYKHMKPVNGVASYWESECSFTFPKVSGFFCWLGYLNGSDDVASFICFLPPNMYC